MYLNIFNEPTETIEDIIIMSNIDQILTPNLINGIEAMSIVIPIRSGLTSISTRTALMDEKGEPVESKPLVYKAKKQTPATAHQVRQLKELMAEYGIADVISWDNLTRSQASRLYDEYRSKYINRCEDDSE